jgi:eukaryotic-like serine/threonine-protein kinase
MSTQTTDPGRRILESSLELPILLGGRYNLTEEIARGGMGRVYRGEDKLLEREVAVKVLDRSLSQNPSFISRFKREARAAARLNHPNVVSLFDYGTQDDTYFIVMEFVPGRPLSELRHGGDRLSPERSAEIALDIAQALECAHQGGVVHRDITSNNVMISPSRTKVADFGIAHLTAHSGDYTTAKNGVIVGTAAYLSPEQARGGRIDERTDIYSLGVVLYEMLTGRVPFKGETPAATAYMHILQQVVPPSLINPEVPAALEAIVLRALAKDPGDRYASAGELASDLGRFLNDEPVRTLEISPEPLPAAQRFNELVPAQVEARPPRRTGWFLIIPMIVAAGIAGWWLSANWDARTAPQLQGRLGTDAVDQLRGLGLDVRVVERHDEAPPGVVTTQTPPAGTEMEKGDTIVLEISTGPAPTLAERFGDPLFNFNLPDLPSPLLSLSPFRLNS